MGFGATARCERLRQKIDFTDQVIDRREHELDRCFIDEFASERHCPEGGGQVFKGSQGRRRTFCLGSRTIVSGGKKGVMPPFLPPLAPAVLAIVNGDF